MALEDVLVHEGRLVSATITGPRIQGEREVDDMPAATFDCLLQFDKGTERDRRTGRGQDHVALLYGTTDRLGLVLRIGPKDKVAVRAPELTGVAPVIWNVDGRPEPMSPPGEVLGYEATLTRETD